MSRNSPESLKRTKTRVGEKVNSSEYYDFLTEAAKGSPVDHAPFVFDSFHPDQKQTEKKPRAHDIELKLCLKTAQLFSAATEIGAIIGDPSAARGTECIDEMQNSITMEASADEFNKIRNFGIGVSRIRGLLPMAQLLQRFQKQAP